MRRLTDSGRKISPIARLARLLEKHEAPDDFERVLQNAPSVALYEASAINRIHPLRGMQAEQPLGRPVEDLAGEGEPIAGTHVAPEGEMPFHREEGVIAALAVGLADVEMAEERARGFFE